MSVALVALLVENIWQEKVQDSQLHQTLQRAYVKAINQNMEAIHEVDEEYVTSTLLTCSQTEQLVSDKTSSLLNKDVEFNLSKGIKSQGNLPSNNDIPDHKANIQISAFDEGFQRSIQMGQLMSATKYNSPQHNSKIERSPTRTLNIEIIQPVDSGESYKFSFKKLQPEITNEKFTMITNLNQANENSRTELNHEMPPSEGVDEKSKVKIKEKYFFQAKTDKSSWNIFKNKRTEKDKRGNNLDTIYQDKKQINRDCSYRSFTKKLAVTLPNTSAFFKGSKEASKKMDSGSKFHYIQQVNNPFTSLMNKSQVHSKQNVSANSRSSKDSNDPNYVLSHLSKERNTKSYLDIRNANQHLLSSKTSRFGSVSNQN